jgi:hypothetical protein
MTFGDFPIINKIKNKIYPLIENRKLDLPPPTDIQPLIDTGYTLNPLQINDPMVENSKLDLPPPTAIQPLIDTGYTLNPLQINDPIEDNILELEPTYNIKDYSSMNGQSWIRENLIPLCYGGFITTCLVTGLILNNTISTAIDTPGAKGEQGVVGIQGDSGLNGKNGLRGEPGIAGLNGEQGEPGEPGIAGLNGIQGEVGATGLTGATGIQGEPGVAGLNGINGSPGANGSTGATGNNGANGSNGADGSSSLFVKTKVTASDPLIRTGSTVIQLSLPAGTYLLVWTGLVKANDVNGGEVVNCGIEDATTGFARGVMFTDLQGAVQRTYIAQQASLSLNAAGNVSVFCNTVNRDASAVIAHQTFSAQKVSTVTVQ